MSVHLNKTSTESRQIYKNRRTMSTPGRKRVQPILIEDDDDTESTSTEFLVSSSSSNTNVQDVTPSLQAPTSEPSSSSTLPEIQQPMKKTLYVALNFDELS